MIGLMMNFVFIGARLGLWFCVAGGGWVGGVVGVVSIGVELLLCCVVWCCWLGWYW